MKRPIATMLSNSMVGNNNPCALHSLILIFLNGNGDYAPVPSTDVVCDLRHIHTNLTKL